MLQGSLENFALDEVLGLLSSTSKTGQLVITSARGTGSLSISDGKLAEADADANFSANGTEIRDIVFELLRNNEGDFSFDAGNVAPGETGEDVAAVLADAEDRLEDWKQIEAVVPSLDHYVAPATELPAEEVTIGRNEWSTLMAVASGCPAASVCDRLSLGEIEGSRQIKDLADRQLVTVSNPSPQSASAQPSALVARAAAEAGLPPVPVAAAPIANELPAVPRAHDLGDIMAPAMAPVANAPGALPPMPTASAAALFAAPLAPERTEEVAATSDAVPFPNPALESLENSSIPEAGLPPVPSVDPLAVTRPAPAPFNPESMPPSPAEIDEIGNVSDAAELTEVNEKSGSGKGLMQFLRSDG